MRKLIIKPKLFILVFVVIALLTACGSNPKEEVNGMVLDQRTYDLAYKTLTIVDSYNNGEIYGYEASDKLSEIHDEMDALDESLSDFEKSNNWMLSNYVFDLMVNFDGLYRSDNEAFIERESEKLGIEYEPSENGKTTEDYENSIDENAQKIVDILNDFEITG